MAPRKPAKSPVRAYIDKMDDMPLDSILGRITLFTVAESPRVTHPEIVQWFEDLWLDEKHLPQQNKSVDAYKKATSDTKDEYAMTGDRVGRLFCSDVSSDGDKITRQITREIRDSGRKKLRHDAAITATFSRPTDPANQAGARLLMKYHDSLLEPSEIDIVHQVGVEIEQRFGQYMGFLDSQKLRAVVRGYLRKLGAIEIKGGVYFVLATRDDELNRLAELVGRFGKGCYMDMIPVPDIVKQRALITRMFEREAAEKLGNVSKAVADLMANRKTITPAAYSKLQAEFEEVLANAENHINVLQISQDLTAASAEIALKDLQKLAEAMVDAD